MNTTCTASPHLLRWYTKCIGLSEEGYAFSFRADGQKLNRGALWTGKKLTEKSIQFEQKNGYIITNLSDKAKCANILKNNSSIKNYTLNTNISSVTIVGYGIKNNSNLLQRTIDILYKNEIEIIASEISNIKLSLLINDQDNEKAIKLLHKKFF